MKTLDDDMRALLRAPAVASLALVDKGGLPHVTPVWLDLDERDRIVINTAEGRKKARILQVGAPAAFMVLDPENAYRYVAVRGTVVERTHEGAREMIDRLAQKYWGRDYTLPAGQQRVTITIEPDWAQFYNR